MLFGTSEPAARLSCLERRVPGETDLRIFTTEVIRAGKHRLEGRRPRVRIRRDRRSGRPVLAAGVAATGYLSERMDTGDVAAPGRPGSASRGLTVTGFAPRVWSVARLPWHERRPCGDQTGPAEDAVEGAEAAG